MKQFPLFFLLFLLPLLAAAQEKRVYTVAGGGASVGDGGPATAAGLASTEGVWIDGNCNLYFCDQGENRVRKVDLETGIITTIAGNGVRGFSGDGGPATVALIRNPYGLYADNAGNVFFADPGNNRIRKVDGATGIISTFAGGGASVGEGGPATNAQLNYPQYVYGYDTCIYIGERYKMRMVNTATGVITTIAGTGIWGFSGDGGMATDAQIYVSAAMILDKSGNLLFADRGNNRIRKINLTTGIISTIAGTTKGYSGDGGPAINAQIDGPISIAMDKDGNLIIGDNGNDVMRFVDASSGIISTVAGVGTTGGSAAEGVLAMEAYMHPEFLYLDKGGNLYYTNFGGQVRKITGFKPGLYGNKSDCTGTFVTTPIVDCVNTNLLFPNPVTNELNVNNGDGIYDNLALYNSVGQLILYRQLTRSVNSIYLSKIPRGVYTAYLWGATENIKIKIIIN